jgi:hypothetical protein
MLKPYILTTSTRTRAGVLVGRYVSPTGAGAMTGVDWANAAPISAINTMIIQARALGRVVFLAADLGPYAIATSTPISITAGGLSDATRVTIQGLNTNGTAAKAVFTGARANPWIAGAASGFEIFRLGAISNLNIRQLRFNDCGQCIRFREPASNVTIEDVVAYNVNTLLENTISSGGEPASVTNLVVRRCQGRGYSKRFARLQYNSSNILFEDCLADSERQDGDNFASGFVLGGTAHDVTYRRCFGNNHIDTLHAYQNGDGFAGERGNYNVLLEDCGAKNNTDGGIDYKGDGIEVVRFVAEGNHRNYRLWGLSKLVDCVGLEPTENAGANPYSKAQVSVFNGALCRIYGGEFTQTVTSPVFLCEQGGIIAVSPSTAVTKPSGALLSSVENADSVNPAGVFATLNPADVTPPTITSAATFAVAENILGSWAITANEVAQLRLVGGSELGAFSKFGSQLRLPRQDYENPDLPSHQLHVQVVMHDTNGNVSAPQNITITIQDRPDDAIGPLDISASDFAWWEPGAPGTLWQDAGGTLAAEVDGVVARMDDRSGKGNHVIFVSGQPILRQEGGVTWLEVDGLTVGNIGATGALRWAQVSAALAIRRAPIDTAGRVLISVPRSLSAPSFNEVWRVGVVGSDDATMRINPNNYTGDGGAALNKDTVIALQSYPATLRVDDGVKVDAADVPSLTYPVSGQARLFSDGNGGARFYGRFYGGVTTNRTEDPDTRFRIANQLAGMQGRVL